MKKKPFFIIVFFLFFSSILFLNGCTNEETPNEEEHMINREMNTAGRTMLDSAVIREAGFEVASADNNKDGMLYQCPMDYEVISDEYGNCPICKMKLEEYTIEKAEQYFNKYMNN